jgi:hypothetical protein
MTTVCSPLIIQHFDYQDDYFKHGFVEKDDIQFTKLLFEDNFHWEVKFRIILSFLS